MPAEPIDKAIFENTSRVTTEHPTGMMRFVKRIGPCVLGTSDSNVNPFRPLMNILQQEWAILSWENDGPRERRTEWRDVTLVEEAEDGSR